MNPTGLEKPKPPNLDERFARLKADIVKDTDPVVLQASYERLKEELAAEVRRVDDLQQAAIPEIQWADVLANGTLRIRYCMSKMATH